MYEATSILSCHFISFFYQIIRSHLLDHLYMLNCGLCVTIDILYKTDMGDMRARGRGQTIFVKNSEKAEFLAWEQIMFKLARSIRVCFDSKCHFSSRQLFTEKLSYLIQNQPYKGPVWRSCKDRLPLTTSLKPLTNVLTHIISTLSVKVCIHLPKGTCFTDQFVTSDV